MAPIYLGADDEELFLKGIAEVTYLVNRLVYGTSEAFRGEGSPYSPSEIIRMIRERFGVDIASKTISNWKSNLPGYMEKYGIRDDYIKEVIDRCLFGDIKHQGIPREEGREVTGNPPREVDEAREVPEEVGSLPRFRSLAEMVGYMERQGSEGGKGLYLLRKFIPVPRLDLSGKPGSRFSSRIFPGWLPGFFPFPFEVSKGSIYNLLDVLLGEVILFYLALDI